jgi:hypothetical protein
MSFPACSWLAPTVGQGRGKAQCFLTRDNGQGLDYRRGRGVWREMSLPGCVVAALYASGQGRGKGPVLSALLFRDNARVVGLWLLHVSPRTCLWLLSALRDKEGESSTASGQGSRGWSMALACLSPHMLVVALRASGQGRGRPSALLLRDNGQGSWTGGRRSGSRQLVVGRMRAEVASTPPSVYYSSAR